MRRVALFVGTRADLGPLRSVISALEDHPDVELHVLVGVAFSADELHAHLQRSLSVPPDLDRVHELTHRMTTVDDDSVLAHGPVLGAAMPAVIHEVAPESLIVLGDRWELLYVVPPAFLAGVRVIHLHGGEVTEGALDERVRHAVTKLADQHCVASEDSARRLRQLGEPAERIHVTGAPGLDLYSGVAELTDEEFVERFGRSLARPLALFTYHPPTAENVSQAGPWAHEALVATLDHCKTVVATYPGMDVGREAVLEALNHLASDHRVILVEALGPAYPRMLATADVVVGNSSSGVIEAASVGVPAVDIGERQRGRLRGPNVLHAEEGREPVGDVLATALTDSFRKTARDTSNPYGDGRSALRIVDVVLAARDVPRTKVFNDCEVP